MAALAPSLRPFNSPFCRHTVTEVAVPYLSAQPEEVDFVLDTFAGLSSFNGFNNAVAAAISLGITTDARHLEHAASFFYSNQFLDRFVKNCIGDPVPRLLAACERAKLRVSGLECLIQAAAIVGQRENPNYEEIRYHALRYTFSPPRFDTRFLLGLLNTWLKDRELEALEVELSGVDGMLFHSRVVESAKGLSILDLVPLEAYGYVHPQPVIRVAPSVGRNERCPCGSGKKFKHCCLSKPEAAPKLVRSSLVPGVSQEAFWANPEPRVTVEMLSKMTVEELLQLDPVKLNEAQQESILKQLTLIQNYEAVVTVLEKIGKLPMALMICVHAFAWDLISFPFPNRQELIDRLAAIPPEEEGSEPGVARALTGPKETQIDEIAFHVYQALYHHESSSLSEGNSALDACLLALASQWPGLGILITRGFIFQIPEEDRPQLLSNLRATRHLLRMPLTDPIEKLVQEHSTFPDEQETERRWADLQEKLANKDQEASELHRRLAELEAQKPIPLTPEVGVVPSVGTDPEVLALRERVHQLRADLKSRHEERNELRRELNHIREEFDKLAQQGSKSVEKNAMSSEESAWEEMEVSSEVRLPRFAESFTAAIARIPKTVVAKSIVSMGEMGAGETGAFSDVKRLVSDRALFRKRIGNYRLLFTLSSLEITAIDLVVRSDFEQSISRARRRSS